MTMRKIAVLFMSVLLVFALVACDENTPSNQESTPTIETSGAPAVPLTDREQEAIDVVGEDLQVVSDDNFAEMVNSFNSDPAGYSGSVYQLEGLLTRDGETAYVSRILVNGDERTDCKLQLEGLSKEIETNAWVRATGIMTENTDSGASVCVLHLIAIESLDQFGNIELTWDGSANS